MVTKNWEQGATSLQCCRICKIFSKTAFNTMIVLEKHFYKLCLYCKVARDRVTRVWYFQPQMRRQ